MQLTILGNYGPYPGPDGAVTGFLVSSDTTNIVLDLGNGSLVNYARHRRWDQLDAVILSHLHEDHIGDVSVLQYVRQYEPNCPAALYLPATPADTSERIRGIRSLNTQLFEGKTGLKIGDMELSFLPVVHPVETYAVRVRCKGKCMVYTSDTAYTEKLIPFAKGADLLLCEAGVLDEQTERKHIHMSVTEGCEIARRANVGHTVFCHLLASNSFSAYQAEINRCRDVRSELARCNVTYTF